MFINLWMHKQIVIYLYHGIINNKEEETSDNMQSHG